ncbi:MAG: radical SAM protein [Candidatus Omnitrophota bacterium]
MKTQSYHDFGQRLHRLARDKGYPLRVMFELTYRCNFRCGHCYVPEAYRRQSNELRTREVFSILEQLRDIGCLYLGFTGGEPFMRRDIMDILWQAKKSGFELIIYTNASLINERLAGELAALGPNKVDITIPGMSERSFESITTVQGAREKVFSAIEFLHKKGIALGFKSCMLKENESEIKDIQNFACSLGAPHRLDEILLPRLDGSREPYRYRGGTSSQPEILKASVSYQLLTADCKPSTLNLEPRTSNLFPCGAGQTQAAITPFGELKMCLLLNFPLFPIMKEGAPVANSGLKNAWEKLKREVNNIKPDEHYQCDKCPLELYCKWCPARSWLYNRTFTSCEPESRLWAKKRCIKLS